MINLISKHPKSNKINSKNTDFVSLLLFFLNFDNDIFYIKTFLFIVN